MTKRTKENLAVIIVIAITLILFVYSLMTIWTGLNLAMFSFEAVEYSEQYTEIQTAREAFYNSENHYINWLANLSNDVIRIPLSLLIIASPVLFFMSVRKYNLSRRKMARMK